MTETKREPCCACCHCETRNYLNTWFVCACEWDTRYDRSRCNRHDGWFRQLAARFVERLIRLLGKGKR